MSSPYLSERNQNTARTIYNVTGLIPEIVQFSQPHYEVAFKLHFPSFIAYIEESGDNWILQAEVGDRLFKARGTALSNTLSKLLGDIDAGRGVQHVS